MSDTIVISKDDRMIVKTGELETRWMTDDDDDFVASQVALLHENIERLQAENKRLRTALERAADNLHASGHWGGECVARNALKTEK